MTHVSILGTGNMGQAIAGVVGNGGNTVELLGTADTATPVTGDVVVLAVPYGAVGDIVARRGEQLAGKVVVDITNPVDFETFASLVVPADGSAAAEIAAALPQSQVVKAFNTTFAATLASGTVGDNTTTVLIAGVASKGGHTVELLGHADTDKPVTGDVVVLAVYYGAVAEVVAQRGEQLAGKVVVDITNPVDVETFDSLVVPADGSATAEIAAALPRSRVVKAFNTNFAATLASGTVGGQPTTVLIAGDDDDAKSLLAGIVTGAGLRALDAGSLRRARELEALGFLQIGLAAGEKIAWTGGFAVVA